MMISMRVAALLGGLLAVGLIWGGSYIKAAAQVWQESARSVTVRGLAEREVPADLALWPLNYTVSADSLGALRDALEGGEGSIRDFLEQAGFPPEHVSVTPPRITDQYAMFYSERLPDERYRAEATVLLRTPDVDAVKATMGRTGELVRAGVLLSPTYEYQTEFLFTGLEALKPEMIAVATADARRAAQQFAEDSDSRVGRIRSATQGYFSISELDSYTPDIKRIRVVTTIEYALED